MINVTVINLKTAVKYLVLISILVIGISFTRFFYHKQKVNLEKGIENINLTACLDTTLPDIQGKTNLRRLEKNVTSRGKNTQKQAGR